MARAWFAAVRFRRSLLALVLVVVGALVMMLVAMGSRTQPRRMPERFVPTEPRLTGGRQMSWLIATSARLPLSKGEWRRQLAEEQLAPAQPNNGLQMRTDAEAVRLLGLSVVQPDALVRDRDGSRRSSSW